LEILSIIPARGDSKEIPMKNLILLDKKPLLHYTIMASKKSNLISRTIVTTDNTKIKNLANKMGAETIVRPKKLASAKAQLEPTIEHVLSTLEKQENYRPDVIVLLQNTSPFRTEKHIDEALEYFFKNQFDSVLSGFRSHYFVWELRKNHVIPSNYKPMRRPNRQEMKNEFIENGAIYITKFTSFKKSKCRLSGKIGLYTMPEILSLQIDTYHDIFLTNNIMKMRKNGKFKI